MKMINYFILMQKDFIKFTKEIRALKRKSCKALVGAESKILNYKGDVKCYVGKK